MGKKENPATNVVAINTDKYQEKEVNYDGKLDIDNKSFLSKLFLSWVNPIVASGYRRRLEPSDIFYTEKGGEAELLKRDFDIEFAKFHKEGVTPAKIVWKIIFSYFGRELLWSFLLHVLYTALRFAGPFFLQIITSYIEGNADFGIEVALAYGFALGCVQAVSTILLTTSDKIWFTVALKARSMMTSAIFAKVLRLSNSAKQKTSEGQVNTFLTTDVQATIEVMRQFNRTVIAPFSLAGGLIYIYYFVGAATFAGLAVLVGFVPFSVYMGKLQFVAQGSKLKKTDSRIKYAKEILQGIKIVKLYAWESPVLKRLTELRNSEVVSLLKIAYLRAFSMPVALVIPNIASVTTFTVFFLTNDSITAADAFTVVSLFTLIRAPFMSVPLAIAAFSQAMVSFRRLGEFLYLEEFQEYASQLDDPEKDVVLKVTDGGFQWAAMEDESPGSVTSADASENLSFRLQNLSFSIKKGELVAIIGQVASGKSSLCSAILEEMPMTGGHMFKDREAFRSIGYCPQEPFIYNATVRENILFKKPYDSKRYKRALDGACLTSDLDVFPAGDMTEIGQRGVTLSGGQKARVSIARAIYANPDVCIFDDPLAAVDAEVGNRLFDNVLSNNKGATLEHATKILVTNQIQFLSQCDRIIVLADGSVAQIGHYDELMQDSNGILASLLEDIVATQETAVEEVVKAPVARSDSQVSETIRPVSQISADSSISLVPDEEKGRLVQVEKREVGSISGEVMKAYGMAGTNGSLCLFYLLTSTFFICEAVFLCIDSWLALFTGDSDDEGLGVSTSVFIGGYWGITLFYLFCVFVRSFGFAKFGVVAAASMYEKMIDHVVLLPMSFFWETPLGTVINRVGGDTNVIDDLLPMSMTFFFMTLVRVLANLTYFCVISPIFTVVLIPIVVIYFAIRQYYGRTSRELQRIEAISRSPVLNQLAESLYGVSSLRAYNLIPIWSELSKKKIEQTHRARFAFEVTQLWLGMRLEFLAAFIIFFCAVAIILTAELGGIDAGLAGLSLSLALNITPNLNFSVKSSTQVEAYLNAVERVREYSFLPIEDLESSGDKDKDGDVEGGNALVKAGANWPTEGRIDLFNVWMRYRENLDPALRDATLTIQGGETVGLCGRTGSGKSTLFSVLFRIVETMQGEVKIDGVSIKDVSKRALRSSLTLIPQDPVLFVGTLRLNIDPFNDYSDEELMSAIRRAHLSKTVANLPQGLDSEIAENGSNLSVGERALICLARALIRNSKIVLLDEATASVDATTDALIQETIKTELRVKADGSKTTMIIIAHRLQTIIDADKIAVLGDGKVLEYDHPHKLLNFSEFSPDAGVSQFASLVAETGADSESKLRELAAEAYAKTKEEKITTL